MPAINFLGGAVQLFDANGNPLAQGKIHTYVAGTSTPKASYPTQADAIALTNANANPTILDAAGRGNVWLNGLYKVVARDAADNTIYTTDNVGDAPARVVSKTTGYTVALADQGDVHACSHATGFTATLPAAASAGAGFGITFVATGAGAITLDGNASETIDGQATMVLPAGNSIELMCDGTGWRTLFAGFRPSAVSVHKNGTDQTGIVTGTPTAVTFSTELYDLQNEYASNVFTAKFAGIYCVKAQVQFNSVADAAGAQIFVYKNGASVMTRMLNNGAVANITASISCDLLLAAGDTIEIYVSHSHGSNRDIEGNADRTWLTIARIG